MSDVNPGGIINNKHLIDLKKIIHMKYIFLVPFFAIVFSIRGAFGQNGVKFLKGNTTTKVCGAYKAMPINGAIINTSNHESGGYTVSLHKQGEGFKLKNSTAAKKLALHYASSGVGILWISINDAPSQKLNIHASGNLITSFLNAIIDIAIPAGADVVITLATENIKVNIDLIATGSHFNLPPDIWNLPQLPIAKGPYKSEWKNISQIYMAPNWWRETKLGVWSHWDPQSMPENGDWYARTMYQENSPVNKLHVKTFGHPSEYGYKDIAHNWIIDQWDPEFFMNLCVNMGARYFMAMGAHHDNFDNWNSAYQPWNAVTVGPKKDIVGTWKKAAQKYGLRFGIGFHNTPPRTWGQFMPVKYGSDKNGPFKGVPYDGLQTISDGRGKWWEGLDPVDLYGPPHNSKDNSLNSPFANQFMWRIDDAINKYHPDVIYFDEHAGDSRMDLGVHMGLGFLAPRLVANYYNKSLKWNNGKMDVVVNLKGVGGRYNSFQNNNGLLPFVEHSLVKSSEKVIEKEISAYPFQTEESISEWHYQTGQKYLNAPNIITILMENVSRNGTLLLNLTQRGRGNLDTEVVQIAKNVGSWLKINGEAIYGSRPFEVYGDSAVYYTRNNGKLYATLTKWKNAPINLKALAVNGATLGNVDKVELLGKGLAISLPFTQDNQGLAINPFSATKPIDGIIDTVLAFNYRVLRITHNRKNWINDDDPGITMAQGWFRQANLGNGSFNNDLTVSDMIGSKLEFSFIGQNVSIVAPKQPGGGKIEVLIDGTNSKKVDLSSTGSWQSQQVVYHIEKLSKAKHTLTLINRGGGNVAFDALIVDDNH